MDEPHQMSWQRDGGLPPWAGEGQAIYHLLSLRVESLEEVRELQKGEGGEGWAK